MDDIAKWLGLLALLLAVVAPLAGMAGVQLSWAKWVILLLGAVVGYLVGKFDVKFALAGLVALAIAGMFAIIPMVGQVVQEIFANIATLVAGILVIPALVVILRKLGIKV